MNIVKNLSKLPGTKPVVAAASSVIPRRASASCCSYRDFLERTLVVSVKLRNICIARHPVGSEFESVECYAIRSLDGARADPELHGNFVTGVLCNATHDQHEPAKHVQASMNVFGVPDQQSNVRR